MKTCTLCHNSYPDTYNLCPIDEHPLPSNDNKITVGSILRDKYEVLSLIGSGGMATVYKVRHRAFQHIAALKVVREDFLSNTEFLKRFRNEAVVAWQLKHPNAVRIDDLDHTENGLPFIVMEYVEGISLETARIHRHGPWPIDESLKIISQVAAALGAAHKLGIVHRDIKPANILITKGQDHHAIVKVLDFGIAKTADRAFAGMTSVQTASGLIIGTPEYMAPEQAECGPDSGIDHRADLYSLGLVLYELVAGTHPFHADTPMGMLVHQLRTPPPALTASNENVPPAISALIMKALHKNRDERFQSADEMLHAMHDPEAWWHEQQGIAPTQQMPTTLPPTHQPTTADQTRPYPVAQIASPPPPTPTPTPVPSATPTPPPQPQVSYTPVPAAPKKRSIGPWLLGSVLLFAAIVAIVFFTMFAAVINRVKQATGTWTNSGSSSTYTGQGTGRTVRLNVTDNIGSDQEWEIIGLQVGTGPEHLISVSRTHPSMTVSVDVPASGLIQYQIAQRQKLIASPTIQSDSSTGTVDASQGLNFVVNGGMYNGRHRVFLRRK